QHRSKQVTVGGYWQQSRPTDFYPSRTPQEHDPATFLRVPNSKAHVTTTALTPKGFHRQALGTVLAVCAPVDQSPPADITRPVGLKWGRRGDSSGVTRRPMHDITFVIGGVISSVISP